jgi:SAM-dependent methyltransferase
MADPRPRAVDSCTIIDGFKCYAPALAADYADYPADGFELTAAVEARSFWCRTRQRVLRLIIDRFTVRTARLDMLEIGCGIGTVLSSLQALPHLRLTGSEIYLEGLHYARRRLPDVDFIQLDATDIPFREAYDVIGAFDVVEHIEADQIVMRGVHAALRPGGLFIVTVPQYQWMWSRLDELVLHKRRYSRRDLLAKLRAADFEPVYTTSFITALFPLMAAARLSGRGRSVSEDAKADLESHMRLPVAMNIVFDWISRIDEALLKRGVSLPFGGSLLVVARRAAPRS